MDYSTGAPVVLVTGGARRVGAAIARAAHAEGARVVIHCNRSRDSAAALVSELNAMRAGSAAWVQGELLDYARLAGLVDAAAECFGGRLDALVNNASAFYPTPMGQLDDRQWEELLGSNLKAPAFLAQAAASRLRASRGAIVNIVDIHAERPLAGYLAYTVAKSGLAGLTRALALELAPEVRVNGVSPGAILWPEDDSFPPAERERITRQTPLARVGSPEDIASAVSFFLFNAPFVTGQILAVDGGRELAL